MSCDLYRFYDKDERLLYVGISLHAAHRASEHRGDKPWWPDVARMHVEHLADRATALAAELEAIRTEDPIHNVVGRLRVKGSTEAVEEFEVPFLVPELTAAQNAIDDLAHRFEQLERDGYEDIPGRGEFIALVGNIARTVMYGDCCDKCYALRHPLAVKKTSPTWVRCGYACPCGNRWASGWTADLALLANMP